MHGQDDPRATLTEGRRVFNAAPGIKEFVVFEKTGHESYVSAHPQKWQSAVKELIRRVEVQGIRKEKHKQPNREWE
jgi:pimeloyl-ACP methyl ester carboxylesterase